MYDFTGYNDRLDKNSGPQKIRILNEGPEK
jgi:hypothetical protein